MKIYLAGPLFTTAERTFNTRLRDLLEEFGHEVWLPQENEPRDKSAAAIFHKDVEGMDWTDVLVANMDGADPDSGTCWECGYAYRKKPVILYRTDFRKVSDSSAAPYNLMMSESADAHVELEFASVEQVAAELNRLLVNIKPRS
jgi:nucleoside 2-deoxyribosyltransferase